MFLQVLTRLTTDQKRELRALGIKPQLLSNWRSGHRIPTEVQIALLASVAGADRHELQDEIALLRATPEQRSLLERVMGKLTSTLTVLAAGVIASMAFGSAQPAWSHGAVADGDNVYYVNQFDEKPGDFPSSAPAFPISRRVLTVTTRVCHQLSQTTAPAR